MTEQQWLRCDDPTRMLEQLHGRASERKLRLFAVACCRRIWPLLTDERSRHAVEVANRYADGEAGFFKLRRATDRAAAATREFTGAVSPEVKARSYAAAAAFHATVAGKHVADSALNVVSAAYFAPTVNGRIGGDAMAAERAAQAALLRCLVGPLPFRPPPMIDAAILAWNDAAVPRIASTIYDDRRFEDLPVLADALEEAGCGEADLLEHLRGGGEHARGCWVVDLLLGRS
jgi:hypothetical protein